MVTHKGVVLVSWTYGEVLEGSNPLGKYTHLCDLRGSLIVDFNSRGSFLGYF